MGELIVDGKIGGWGQSQATEDQVRRADPLTEILTFAAFGCQETSRMPTDQHRATRRREG